MTYYSTTVYELYYIYEKVGDKYYKIMETEDFLICSPLIQPGHIYYIEAYSKNEETNEFELRSRSEDYKCIPKDFVPGKDVKISIVIPVYNVQNYINRTLASVFLSNFNDIELIIINDGSKDYSRAIIEWYAKKYSSIVKVIDQENHGVIYSRNRGIKEARGEYLIIEDSDDMLHPNMLSKMYEIATKENFDVVVSNIIIHNNFDDTSVVFKHLLDPANANRYIRCDYEDFILNKFNGSDKSFYFSTLWPFMCKTSIYSKHKIPIVRDHEDIAYIKTLFSYCNTFAFSMDSYYVWDRRVGLTTGSLSSRIFRRDSYKVRAKSYIEAMFAFERDYNKAREEYAYYDAVKEVEGTISGTVTMIYEDHNFKYENDNPYMDYFYVYAKKDKDKIMNNKFIKKDKDLIKMLKRYYKFMEEREKEKKEDEEI